MGSSLDYSYDPKEFDFKDKYGFDPWSKDAPKIDWGFSSPSSSSSSEKPSSSSDDKFGETFKKWGQAADLANKWRNRDNNSGFSGGGFSGGGVQGYGDFMVFQPPQQQPYTIQGFKGFGGALGTLAGIGASFIPGLGSGIAAAMPAIGGSVGSMFG